MRGDATSKMNVYRQAMPETKRAGKGKVVTMVLQPLRASALTANFLIGSQWE
jgi:predicted DNA-binding protein (UPF0251 family)